MTFVIFRNKEKVHNKGVGFTGKTLGDLGLRKLLVIERCPCYKGRDCVRFGIYKK